MENINVIAPTELHEGMVVKKPPFVVPASPGTANVPPRWFAGATMKRAPVILNN